MKLENNDIVDFWRGSKKSNETRSWKSRMRRRRVKTDMTSLSGMDLEPRVLCILISREHSHFRFEWFLIATSLANIAVDKWMRRREGADISANQKQ